MRLYRANQDRNGSTKRRRLEYDVIMDNVRRRKQQFMRRLESRIVRIGECRVYQGTLDHKGYARLNLSYKPTEDTPAERVTIGAHRLFLILKLRRPIRRGFEAGHLPECEHRACVLHLREEHYKSNAASAR